MNRLIPALLLALFAAGGFAAPVPDAPPLQMAQAGGRERLRVTLDQAVALVQRQTGGRVLAAQEARPGGRPAYRIKVVTPQGEVRTFHVDAETGAALPAD